MTQAPSTPKPSVLCIDDSPGMLLICRAILEANGYAVFTASGAWDGLEILQHNLVNAAVIDDGLKDMSTIRLVRELRSICRDLPVVVFTRSPAPDWGVADAEIYVDKARGPKALLAAVNKICERGRGFQA